MIVGSLRIKDKGNRMNSVRRICVITFTILSFIVVVTANGADSKQTSAPKSDGKDGSGLRSSYGNCLKSAGGVVPDMQDCIDTEYGYQDKRLNTAYKTLMGKLNKAQQTTLRSDERKWITHRDSYCAPDQDGGHGQRLEANDCALEETAKRASELEAR